MIKGGRNINNLAALFAKRLSNNDLNVKPKTRQHLNASVDSTLDTVSATESTIDSVTQPTPKQPMTGGSVEQLLKSDDITVDSIIREVEFEHQDAVFKDVDFSNVVVGTLNENLNQLGGDVEQTARDNKPLTGGADLEEMKENIFAGGAIQPSDDIIIDIETKCSTQDKCIEIGSGDKRVHFNIDGGVVDNGIEDDDVFTGGAKKFELPDITNDNSEEIIENILIDAKKDISLKNDVKSTSTNNTGKNNKSGDEIIEDILIDCSDKGSVDDVVKNSHQNIIENILIDAKKDISLKNDAKSTSTNKSGDEIIEDILIDCKSKDKLAKNKVVGDKTLDAMSDESADESDEDDDMGDSSEESDSSSDSSEKDSDDSDSDEMNSDAPEPEDFEKVDIEFVSDDEPEDDAETDSAEKANTNDTDKDVVDDLAPSESLAEIMAAIHRAHERQRQRQNVSRDIVRDCGVDGSRDCSRNNGANMQHTPYMVGGRNNKKATKYCKVIHMYPWVVAESEDEE